MQPTERRLFLVDGYGLIYRAFYAMLHRPLRTSRGENTSAIFGVTQFLLRLLERQRPAYLGWVHDAGTSGRAETFPAYKATRERLAPELQADFDRSVERVKQLLSALRVPLIAVDGYEADDVMGTLATKAAAMGVPTVLVSGDKDLYQLVSDGISLLNPGRGGPAAVDEQWVDTHNAAERLGVAPERVVDFLALVGDSSDNVPGVRGVGEKTARALIERWGDLETILSHAGEAPRRRVQEALRTYAEDARLSRRLVTIRRDVPIEPDLPALAVREPDREALRQVLAELEFHELLQRLELERPVGAQAGMQARTVTDPEEIPAIARALSQEATVVIRTLPSDDHPRPAALVGLALARGEGGDSWYFPFGHRPVQTELMGGHAQANLPPLDDPRLRPIADLLENASVPKMGHDVKRDLLALRRAGVRLDGVVWDGSVGSFVLDPGRRSHALSVLALELERLSLDDDAGAAAEARRQPTEESPEAAAARAALELEAIIRLQRRFASAIEAHRLGPLLAEIELPLITVLADMEWRGIAVDLERLRRLGMEFGVELERLERAIYHEAGTEFNIHSTPQLRHVLFEKLQLPVLKRTKTGPSTDADVLEQLAAMQYSVPALLLEFRELSKLKSTYVDVLPAWVHPDTGRIHARFHQTGAATGRLSSSDPNLQNIPVRTERGERIRQCFIPAPGCRLVVADYSQIELRLLAHLSQDPAFVQAFERGGDVHRETAAVIFGVPPEAVTPDMRARAKTINFATIYGQGPFALSRQLGIAPDDAKKFIRLYFERFAGVRRWLDEAVAQARERGYTETLFGRRRYIPELHDRNHSVRSFGERTAMNSPLQGSAADLIKVAMVRLHHELARRAPGSGILLQVHDELVLEAPEAEVPVVVEIVRCEMEGAARLRVPLVVTVGVGVNWLEAKG